MIYVNRHIYIYIYIENKILLVINVQVVICCRMLIFICRSNECNYKLGIKDESFSFNVLQSPYFLNVGHRVLVLTFELTY